jgi:hypothetical protein
VNWDVTKSIQRSPLWKYAPSAGIWKCPADRSVVDVKGRLLPRVRSMTMSVWMGGFGGEPPQELDSGWRVFLSLRDLTDPGPSQTWLFIDQREDSINLGNFYTDMRGYPDKPGEVRFSFDYPASYHMRSGGLSFADGHSETRRWLDNRTMPPIKKGKDSLAQVAFTPSPRNRDIIWLQARATRRR